jgi:hypothetical protein
MLIVEGILNLIVTSAKIGYPDSMTCLTIPLLVVVPSWAAAALLPYAYPRSTESHGIVTDT